MIRLLSKIILGVILFFLITGYIIIPLVLSWAIQSQGTKVLKHPVRLHSVEFNPFSLHLTINNLAVLDQKNQVMIGFDQLSVRVSFSDLFKKILHIQDLEVSGLNINAELSSGNKLNLTDLLPQESAASVKNKPTSGKKEEPLPAVIIDTIAFHQGQIHFTDDTIKPNFTTTVSGAELRIRHVATDPLVQTKTRFQANLEDKGRVSMEMVIKPLAKPLDMETTVSLNSYALKILSPYIIKYTGHQLNNGNLDLIIDYRISNNKLTATHKFLIQRFEFGTAVQSKDALHLPFGLAVALLEDPQGKINIALPVSGDISDPKFQYLHLFGQVASNFFVKVVTKPFTFLASALGGSQSSTDELGYVRFSPGKSDLSDSQHKKLLNLIKGLKEHPRLRLEINGSYDPQADWKAIQADTFAKDYEKLQKDSTGPESKVYQILYQRRFGIRALWALAKKYKEGVAQYDDVKLDQEIKRQLIENSPPDKKALNVLAQTRAQTVHDFLVTNGFDVKRLQMGNSQSTQSSMGYVPLQFTLTVFDK
jgi:hypothetical protein